MGKVQRRCEVSFFTQRVVGVWNALLGVVVEADTIGAFKGVLNKHMNMQGIEEYGPREAEGISLTWRHVRHNMVG